MLPLTEYKSSQLLHDDLTRHHRRKAGPQQQFKQPMVSSHEVGWLEGLMPPVGETRYRHRSSDLSQFASASARASRGQSAQTDMSRVGKLAVASHAGFGLGV